MTQCETFKLFLRREGWPDMGDEYSVVRFEKVGKRFTFTRENSQSVLEVMTSAFRRKTAEAQERHFWALRDVTFDITAGQCVGIVGRNGSGKSTALKLMARILRPTEGRVQSRGRVSALLELGAGFHPDLTGRENIYLNASLLGLSRADVDRQFDDIVAFSELGDFIEMPVKHYSSGMYMRLGFSVAIHVQPDILIVDEILAVGDQAFQEKCIQRIYEMKRQGVTIIIVSHNAGTIHELCSHVIWLERGQVRLAGRTADVLPRYVAHFNEGQKLASRLGGEEPSVEITAVRLLNSAGESRLAFVTGEAVTVEVQFTPLRPLENLRFNLALYRDDGVYVSWASYVARGVFEQPGRICYAIEALPLLPEMYRLQTAVTDEQQTPLSLVYEQAFEIIADSLVATAGLVRLTAVWQQPQPIKTDPPQPEFEIIGQ
jgi:lipopolysaccharide transport system ATP-binding protein